MSNSSDSSTSSGTVDLDEFMNYIQTKDDGFGFDRAEFAIPFVSAPISMLSSMYLIYTILCNQRNTSQWKRPKEQLLLGLSCLDICISSGFSFSTVPAPHWINARYPTLGTTQTCHAQAFFVQVGIVGVPLYNACICIYYILTVRYRIRPQIISKYVLPVMHCGAITFGFGTALAAWQMGIFGFDGLLGCWINDEERWICHCEYDDSGSGENSTTTIGGLTSVILPDGLFDTWGCYGAPRCDFEWEYPCSYARNQSAVLCEECLVCPDLNGGMNASDFAIYFAAIPLGICFVFVSLSMAVLFYTVKQTEQRSRRWDFPGANDTTSGVSMSQRTLETGILYSGAMILTFLPAIINGAVGGGANYF